MKVSLSLPDDDVDFLDHYSQHSGLRNRSAVAHLAVTLLREQEMQGDYAAAHAEWEDSGEAGVWDTAAGDGLA